MHTYLQSESDTYLQSENDWNDCVKVKWHSNKSSTHKKTKEGQNQSASNSPLILHDKKEIITEGKSNQGQVSAFVKYLQSHT